MACRRRLLRPVATDVSDAAFRQRLAFALAMVIVPFLLAMAVNLPNWRRCSNYFRRAGIHRLAPELAILGAE
jgi:hypothetical protein